MILPSRRSASLAVPATLVPSRRWGGIRPNRPSVRGSRLARLARPAPRVDADVPARIDPLPIHHRPLIQFAEQLPLLNFVKFVNVSLLHFLTSADVVYLWLARESNPRHSDPLACYSMVMAWSHSSASMPSIVKPSPVSITSVSSNTMSFARALAMISFLVIASSL